MKKIALAVALLIYSAAPAAHGACTQEDIAAKSVKLQELIAQAAQNAPEKIQEIAEAMQKDLPVLQQATDLDPLCKAYDGWMEKLTK